MPLFKERAWGASGFPGRERLVTPGRKPLVERTDAQAGSNSCGRLDRCGGAGAPETVAMRYGGGARLDMESPLLRGIAAPERRTGSNRSAHAKAPHRQGWKLTSGALDDSGPHAPGG